VTARAFDRSRLRLGLVIAVICGALAFLVLQGLGNATTYYRYPDEALAEHEDLGTRRFRLQGIVVPGSIRSDGPDVVFEVERDCVSVPVRHRGVRPQLFGEGIPVVLEGGFAAAAGEAAPRYDSDRIIVRHTEEYRTEESQEAEATERERCDRSTS
jgi:cytochrome c-type biogenesis protein CcmE